MQAMISHIYFHIFNIENVYTKPRITKLTISHLDNGQELQDQLLEVLRVKKQGHFLSFPSFPLF